MKFKSSFFYYDVHTHSFSVFADYKKEIIIDLPSLRPGLRVAASKRIKRLFPKALIKENGEEIRFVESSIRKVIYEGNLEKVDTSRQDYFHYYDFSLLYKQLQQRYNDFEVIYEYLEKHMHYITFNDGYDYYIFPTL